jgi:hypothetical protein
MLSPRDLMAILWNGRLLLLASVLIGIAWGFLVLPAGPLASRSQITIAMLPFPEGQVAGNLDPWAILLQSADLIDGEDGLTIESAPDALSLTLTRTGEAGDAHEQLINRLHQSLKPASDAFLDQLETRLAGAGARASQFVADGRARPEGVFTLSVRYGQVAPRGVFAIHARLVLIALGAGIAATFVLHLLAWRRRQIAKPPQNS